MKNTNSKQSFCFKSLETERIMLLPLSDYSIKLNFSDLDLRTCQSGRMGVDVTDDGIDIWYAIVDKEKRSPIGMIGMVHRHPEWKNTGLWIVIPDAHNRREGYGLEALGLMEQYIFDSLAYQRIAVRIAECNQTAVRFFKKAGYKLEGVQELGYFDDDKYYDVILLRLLRKEYMGRRDIST